ncbi:MAG: hypothetical protein ABW133_07795 [Polyangiaceae bacterium]
MGDPQRLLSSMNGDELERELLGSLRDVGPSHSAKRETWNKIAVSTAAVATIGTGSAAVQALGRSGAFALANATKAFTAKVAIGVAIAGTTAAGGGWLVHQQQSAAATARAKIAAHVASPSPTALGPTREVAEPAPITDGAESANPAPIAEPVPSHDVRDPAPHAATPTHKAAERAPKGDETRAHRDSLAFESRMLTDARAQLHAGDPRGALATLDKLRARSPKAVLTQERDVLTIQILSSLGDVTAAKRKAKEFLAAYPESPHAPQMQRLLDGG